MCDVSRPWTQEELSSHCNKINSEFENEIILPAVILSEIEPYDINQHVRRVGEYYCLADYFAFTRDLTVNSTRQYIYVACRTHPELKKEIKTIRFTNELLYGGTAKGITMLLKHMPRRRNLLYVMAKAIGPPPSVFVQYFGSCGNSPSPPQMNNSCMISTLDSAAPCDMTMKLPDPIFRGETDGDTWDLITSEMTNEMLA